jgi:hypothetical protein
MVTVNRPFITYQLRLKSKHQTGLSLSGMQSAPKLIPRDQRIQTGNTTPQKARKNRHRWRLNTQFPRRSLKQSDLPPMGVEQHQPLYPLGTQLSSHLDDQLSQQSRGQAQGSRKT